MTFDIHAEWDAEAGVWIATSEEVLGLCVQAETFDELVEVVAALVPELYHLSFNFIILKSLFNIGQESSHESITQY